MVVGEREREHTSSSFQAKRGSVLLPVEWWRGFLNSFLPASQSSPWGCSSSNVMNSQTEISSPYKEGLWNIPKPGGAIQKSF